MFQQTTQVPNVLFDTHIPNLTESELKLLLIIIRQTNGWVDKRTGKRKTRDRISHTQFIQKTGLCRRVITKTLKNLIDKRLISITDSKGNLLHQTEERKGRAFMLYASTFQSGYSKPMAQSKRVYTAKHISEFLEVARCQLKDKGRQIQ